MNAMLWLALFGCEGTQIEYGSEPCEDWSFDAEEPVYEIWQEGGNLYIEKSGVFQPVDALFTPEINGETFNIAILESWQTGGAEEEACFTAFVTLFGPSSGDWEVFWFAEGESIRPDLQETVSVP